MKFKKFLAEFGLENKPIFITEVQFGDLVGKPKDIEKFDELLAKSTVFALVQGVDKLFYIENWLFWDTKKSSENKLERDPKALESSTHKVYLNLVKQLNYFDKVEILNEEYIENPRDNEGTTSNIGHYKFTYKNKIIYVLWGGAQLPEALRIEGMLKITDIYGKSQEVTAGDEILSDSPIFVEVL